MHPKHCCISLLLIGISGLAGCGDRRPPMPQTYPVHGRVTFKNGTPVTEGMVRFEPQSSPVANTVALINKDGAYSLITTIAGRRAEGAVPGANRVSVVLPAKGDALPTPPVIFPKPFNVEAKENDIPLKLDR
jgi:hypothetical protein